MSDDLTLLMIAYCFPPLAGAGVFRTLKLVKHLPMYGVTPRVISADDPTWPIVDESLLDAVPPHVAVDRVAPKRTLERLQALNRLLRAVRGGDAATAVPSGAGDSRRRSLLRWVHDRLLIPDEKRFWLRPAVAASLRAIRSIEGPVCLYATAPPFTDLAVAVEVKQRTNVPLIVDFRDAWAGNPVYMDGLSSDVAAAHLAFERRVIEAADVVLAVAPGILASLRQAHADLADKMRLLPNGFDPEDFDGVDGRPPTDRLVFAHTGELYPTRDPSALLRALARLRQTRPGVDFEMRFVGHRDRIVAARMDRLIDEMGLEDVVKILPPVSHEVAIRMMSESHVLVFQSAFRPGDSEVGRTYPGKIFEYMAARRPVLGIVPGGDAAQLIDRTGCGWWRSPDDVEGLVSLLVEIVDRWSRGERLLDRVPDLAEFDRRHIAKVLAGLAQGLVTGRSGR